MLKFCKLFNIPGKHFRTDSDHHIDISLLNSQFQTVEFLPVRINTRGFFKIEFQFPFLFSIGSFQPFFLHHPKTAYNHDPYDSYGSKTPPGLLFLLLPFLQVLLSFLVVYLSL